VEVGKFPKGKEYRVRAARLNEQWQSDAGNLFVVGWGRYYWISVRDDNSRFILAWGPKLDVTTDSIGEVVQRAVDRTYMTQMPVEDRSRLLTNRG
jgi:hypothetical protein